MHANGRRTTASEERLRRRTFRRPPDSHTQHANDKQESRKARQSLPRPPNKTSRVSQKSGELFAISSPLFAKSRLLLTAPRCESPTGFDTRGAMWAMSSVMLTYLRRFLAAGMFKLHFTRPHAAHGLAKTLSFARQKARIEIFLAKFANTAAAQTQEQAASIRRTGNAPPAYGGATAQIHPLSMSQSQGFRQQTEQRQVQNASSVQVLLSSLIEMPLADFETRLQNELLDNEALEVSDHEENDGANYQNEEGETYDAGDPLDDAVGDYRTLDDVPDNLREAYTNRGEDDRRERQIGAEETSYDDLYRQIGELDLTEHERAIMVYLVGSLDESGFLTKDDATLADELAFNEYIDTTPEEVARLAGLLQQFEPRGIGARNLRECLLLQLPRTGEAREVIDRFYDDFMHSRWNRIAERLQLTDEDIERIRREIGHLNPRPGSVLSEGSRATAPTVVPDFRVTIDTDGNPVVTQHRGDLPDLRVSPAFAETLVMHRAARERAAERGETAQFSRSQEEAFVYAYQKVTAAQAFIESVRRRHHTLQAVMETIVALQREFFVNDDDETLLVPMVLKDVAERAHVDISTVSRAINSKYVETDYGVYSLRHFFSTQFTSADGETVAARQVKAALAEIVENEDKRAPLSDEAIVEALAERGLKVARRTVSKYRSQLNIPKAGLRR